MFPVAPVYIINYGLGNVGSIINMIKFIGYNPCITSVPSEICKAKKLILPGVGAFDAGINSLKEKKLDHAIIESVKNNGATILGICLGMQLLMESSEEGSCRGLGLVPGKVYRFSIEDKSLRIPHMGWNIVRPLKSAKLIELETKEQRFYFVHSYFVDCFDKNDIVGVTDYGGEFTSILERDSILGVQFHPEKSHRYGARLLQKFMDLEV